METIDGNKLIAEFMGAIEQTEQIKPARAPLGKMYFQGTNNRFPDLMFTCYAQDLRYNSSWDWIMPVVVKINKSGKMVSINLWSEAPMTECKIYNWELGSPFQEAEEENAINAIWTVVVEHIIYLNTIKTLTQC